MKKLFTILGIASISLMMNAQNLLTNPGFETGLAPWAAGTTSTYTTPTVFSDGYTGTGSAGYASPTATNGFFQNVPVTEGKTYKVVFWYKSSGNSRLWSIYKNATGTPVYTTADATTDQFRTSNGYLPAAAAWTQFTATMPAGTAVTNLDVAFRVYTGVTAQFDDITVSDASLAVSDLTFSKRSLVKTTLVNNTLTFAAKSNIQVVNMNGQVIKSASVDNNSTLDISALPKGVYLVKGLVNGEQSVQKFIKN